MHSSGHKRIDVLARHLRSSQDQSTVVQQILCEAQSDDGKVVTAEQAAALVPDNAIITVSRPSPINPHSRETKLRCTLDSSICCCRCLDS